MKVSLNKKYKTIAGANVRVLCVDGPDSTYPVVVLHDSGRPEVYTADGYCYSDRMHSSQNLVEVSPYEDWPIDAKIFVRDADEGDEWSKAHFAGIDHYGFPLAWSFGKTSFTTEETVPWREAKLT